MGGEKDFGYYVRLARGSPHVDDAEPISPYAWVLVGLLLAIVLAFVVYWALKFFWQPKKREAAGAMPGRSLRHPVRGPCPAPAVGDPQTMDLVGEEGTAVTDLAPDGFCEILGRRWPCRTKKQSNIPVGTRILVVGWEGDRYLVANVRGGAEPSA